MNIFFWLIYYIKCGINLLLAKIFNLFKSVKEDKKILKFTKKKKYQIIFI